MTGRKPGFYWVTRRDGGSPYCVAIYDGERVWRVLGADEIPDQEYYGDDEITESFSIGPRIPTPARWRGGDGQ